MAVVIPVRNAMPYLGNTLRSVELNRDVDLQLVLVDDGSDDGSTELMAEFAADRCWVDVSRKDVAGGPAAARNTGLDQVRAPLVTFLDSDDWIAPGYVNSLVQAIDALDCDFVRVDHIQVRDRERLLYVAPEGRRDLVLDPQSGILPANRRTMVDYPFSPTGIYRRSLGDLLEFDNALHTAEDRLWIWRLHLHAASYAVTSLAGMFYRRLVSDSLTQVGDARQLHFVTAYEKILAEVAGRTAFETKALRQFLAILFNQLAAAEERLSLALRHQLDRSVRALLASVDPVTLMAAMPHDTRADTLRAYVPGETGVAAGAAG